MDQINIILMTLISVIVILSLFFLFKKNVDPEEENIEVDPFSLPVLETGIKQSINEITNQNIAQLRIKRSEIKKREQQKIRLNNATRNCAQGNLGERDFVKDYIKDLLQSRFGINEQTICNVIPFDQPTFLSSQDKFEILYTCYNKHNHLRGFEEINKHCNFDRVKRNDQGSYYEIDDTDISNAYDKLVKPLTYIERLEVITQRIYQNVYGLSVADTLRYDLSIDGISGGCSGVSSEEYNYMEEVLENGGTQKTKAYNSLWVFYHGKAIFLSFLNFRSQQDLTRTCKNLYRYGSVGHLTSKNGYKLTYQMDGSRVVVLRPKLVTHWAFFVRKFESARTMSIEELVKNDMVVEFLKWTVKGCLNAILSGDQNSGKTTCLKAIATFFDRRNPIRTTEQEFELWLNNLYDNMNCLCFRGSDDVSIADVIAIEKKTDAMTMLLGEINSYELAAAFLTLCQSGTKLTLCTGHWKSTDDAIDFIRNANMASGIFNNDLKAEAQIVNNINLDIHWEKSSDGKRYISYINEIVPLPRESIREQRSRPMESIAQSLELMARQKAYYVRPLVIYEKGNYALKNMFSEPSIEHILRNVNHEETEEFMRFLARYNQEEIM